MIGFNGYARKSKRLVAMTWGAGGFGRGAGVRSPTRRPMAVGRFLTGWRGRNACSLRVQPVWRR